MKIESLHIGMKVRHPQYGLGTVKSLHEHSAEVRFDDGTHAVEPQSAGLQAAEPQVAVSGLDQPLATFLEETARALVQAMGVERADSVSDEIAARWHNGRMVLHPADSALLPKEVPLEVFFHKIVMMRNNLRVLEQKLNSHEKLSEADKIDMQQYLTRCYGSMTTFNVLFRRKEDQFTSKE